MAMDKNYFRLAQLINKKSTTDEVIEEIFNENQINYQIPIDEIHDVRMQGHTALHIVAYDLNTKAVERLIEHGANCTIKNNHGDTALHQIFMNYLNKLSISSYNERFYPIVRAMLKYHITHEIAENPCNKYGLSHLHIACIVGYADVVKFFIERNLSVNAAINMDSTFLPGYTPLHFAATYGWTQLFKILLDAGADVRSKDEKGLSPLHILIQGNMGIADLLRVGKEVLNDEIKKKFEENENLIEEALTEYKSVPSGIIDDTGLSFFHVACMFQDDADILKLMLFDENINVEHSVKTDSPLWPGYTALHFAAHFSYIAVKVLSMNGGNILAEDAKGVTPLDLCLQRYRIEDVYFIVHDHPLVADIELSDGRNSLLDLFLAMKDEESLENFIRHIGPDTFVPTSSVLWPGYTPLHLAVKLAGKPRDEEYSFHFKRIEMLMSHGDVDVRAADLHGSTPIHLAFRMQKFELIYPLLHSREMIIDVVDDENVSFLHITCAALLLSAIRNIKPNGMTINLPLKSDYLLLYIDSRGHTVNYLHTAGTTPLHMAVNRKEIELVELLLSHGADIHAKDSEGLTPVHRLLDLSWDSNLQAISTLLLSSENLRDSVTGFGLSHLHVACWTNNAVAVDKLLDQGADINATVSSLSDVIYASGSRENSLRARYGNWKPLCFALANTHKDVIEVIFRRCNDLCGDPVTILRAARYSRSVSTATLHITHAATFERWERDFNVTALHAACYRLDADAVEKLLKRGAHPNARVSPKSTRWPDLTPLHIVITLSSFHHEKKIHSTAKILIEYGADVLIKNPDGNTVINEVVCDSKRKKIMLLLLSGQKDFTINPALHNRGISHFHMACVCNAVSIVKQFIEHGVNVNQTIDPMEPFGGCTPLHLAAIFNSRKTVTLLLKNGADVHARNADGNTPLHCAADCEYVPGEKPPTKDKKDCGNIMESLIGARADLSATNIYNKTPLEVLLERQRPSARMLNLLLDKERHVNRFHASGAGFIGTSIHREKNIKNIVEHPVYQAVITSSRINEMEKCHRTPIHNIVSIRKPAASTKVYTKAIEGFLKVGFDIDRRDINGETALHAAVRFRNAKGVEALLSLGADINLLCQGKTPLSQHWTTIENASSDLTGLLESQRRILKLLSKQIYKFDLLDWDISDFDLKIETELWHRKWDIDLSIVEQCQVELERLESRRIEPHNITLHSFLSETGAIASYPKMLHQERQAINYLFQNHGFRLRQDFPELAGILHMQYRKAVARMSLIEPAANALDLLVNYYLPDLCKDHILQFLSNSELENVIESSESHFFPLAKRRKIN